jgi:hypothetical protein
MIVPTSGTYVGDARCVSAGIRWPRLGAAFVADSHHESDKRHLWAGAPPPPGSPALETSPRSIRGGGGALIAHSGGAFGTVPAALPSSPSKAKPISRRLVEWESVPSPESSSPGARPRVPRRGGLPCVVLVDLSIGLGGPSPERL